MNLEEKINQEIKTATLAKDNNRLLTVRAIKATLLTLNATGKDVTDEIQLKSLQTMIKQRQDSAKIYNENNRPDLYEKEIYEISIIETFLPKQMCYDEIEIEVKLAIESTGAKTQKEMGKVIGIVNKKLVGKADGRVISEITKKLLN